MTEELKVMDTVLEGVSVVRASVLRVRVDRHFLFVTHQFISTRRRQSSFQRITQENGQDFIVAGDACQVGLRSPRQPDEVADVIIFLASPESRWIKGQDLVIDGGMTAT